MLHSCLVKPCIAALCMAQKMPSTEAGLTTAHEATTAPFIISLTWLTAAVDWP